MASPMDFVRWAASRMSEYGLFFGHGTDNAVDEAFALVLHALHLEPGTPAELLEAKLTSAEKAKVVSLIRRRIETRMPAAYLTGEAWFAGLKFAVDERVLIPRSPIAEWIERGFEPFLNADDVRRVLDLGTGSGCIAVACAMAFPDAHVDATDNSLDALEVARANVSAHRLADRVRPLFSDGFDDLDGEYDLIVSNPPYVPEASYRSLPPEYLHEPASALVAGADGLDVVSGILRDAPRYLSGNGLLVVEVGEARPALESRHPRLPFIWLEMSRGGDNVFVLTRSDLGP